MATVKVVTTIWNCDDVDANALQEYIDNDAIMSIPREAIKAINGGWQTSVQVEE